MASFDSGFVFDWPGTFDVPAPNQTPLPVPTFKVQPTIIIYVGGQPVTFQSPGVTAFNVVPGSLQEAVQRVFNALLVPLHSQIIGYPYGFDMSWSDKPFNSVQQQAAQQAVVKVIKDWVPNVAVKKCSVAPVKGSYNVYGLTVTLEFIPPNTSNQAVFGPPGGTQVTTTDWDYTTGAPATVVEVLTI